MASKQSKSERKEEKIQQLEREIVNLKRKNLELQQQKTVRLNDAQLQGFLDDLSQRIEWSTNRIVDEPPRTTVVHSNDTSYNDGLSFFMKWLIAIPFFIVAIAVAYTLYSVWGEFWRAGWTNRISLFVVGIADIDCFALGIEILKEKDRNYIVSVFSALVAIVALIVSLVK